MLHDFLPILFLSKACCPAALPFYISVPSDHNIFLRREELGGDGHNGMRCVMGIFLEWETSNAQETPESWGWRVDGIYKLA